MRKVTKADCKRDINDGQMQIVRVSQHREGTLKPTRCKVLNERISGPFEQFLHVSPRDTERSGNIVQVEIGIAKTLRDLRQDRLLLAAFTPRSVTMCAASAVGPSVAATRSRRCTPTVDASFDGGGSLKYASDRR